MWFIFLAALILTAAVSVVYIRNFRKVMSSRARFYTYGVSAIIVLLGLWDLFFGFGDLSGGFSLMGAAAALEFALYFFLQRKESRTLVFMGKLLFAAVMLELTLFQFPSFRLFFGEYPHTVLYASDAALENCTYSSDLGGVLVSGEEEVSLTFRDLDCKIGTVHVNVRFDSEKSRILSFFADLTDETGYYYRMKIIDSTVIADSEYSLDAMAQMSGKSTTARFRFSGIDTTDSGVIESIELNRPIPFDVMLLRVVLITLLGTFLYACLFSATMKLAYSKNLYFCRIAAMWMTIAALWCSTTLVLQQIPKGGFADRFKLTEGDQITEELVVAFENRQFDLLIEVDESLSSMENPYDTGKRYYDEVLYMWDHAYYNGKYYSYYGIAPLLLFIPYHLITGYFFPSDVAVMLFCAVGLIFLSLLYSAVVRRWFKNISSGAYVSGLAILFCACGMWFSAGRPLFYEISISAGFACCTAAAYFLITSGLADGKRIKLGRAFGSSLLFGLSVMCRPTLAVYAVCACVFYFLALKSVKAEKINAVKYLACVLAPLACLGLFQMYYNYARFGSILEFGIKYSLTINDFTRTEYHVHLMLIGIYNFLLAPPAFIPDYPFVSAPFSMLGVNGYYFKDEGTISGVLFLALPIFGYFLSGRALKKIGDKKERRITALKIALPCLVMPFVVVCSVWESGYSSRYMADFSWQIIMGAYILLFFLYKKCSDDKKRELFTRAMGICAVYSLVVCGIEIYNFAFPMLSYPRYAHNLVRLMEFWR